MLVECSRCGWEKIKRGVEQVYFLLLSMGRFMNCLESRAERSHRPWRCRITQDDN